MINMRSRISKWKKKLNPDHKRDKIEEYMPWMVRAGPKNGEEMIDFKGESEFYEMK